MLPTFLVKISKVIFNLLWSPFTLLVKSKCISSYYIQPPTFSCIILLTKTLAQLSYLSWYDLFSTPNVKWSQEMLFHLAILNQSLSLSQHKPAINQTLAPLTPTPSPLWDLGGSLPNSVGQLQTSYLLFLFILYFFHDHLSLL